MGNRLPISDRAFIDRKKLCVNNLAIQFLPQSHTVLTHTHTHTHTLVTVPGRDEDEGPEPSPPEPFEWSEEL